MTARNANAFRTAPSHINAMFRPGYWDEDEQSEAQSSRVTPKGERRPNGPREAVADELERLLAATEPTDDGEPPLPVLRPAAPKKATAESVAAELDKLMLDEA